MIIKTLVISLGTLCFFRPLKSVMHQSMLSPRVGGGGCAYPGGFDILAYFHVKVFTQGENTAVK